MRTWRILKSSVFFLLTALCVGLVRGQEFPVSSGGCHISASGLESCSFLSSVPKTGSRKKASEPSLRVSTFTLAPGARLGISGKPYDTVILAESKGVFLNEKESPQERRFVKKGQVMLARRDGAYELRNVGETDLTLVLISVN
jgi:hypothetical protein